MKNKLLLLVLLLGLVTNSASATDVKTFAELQAGVVVSDAELNLLNSITTGGGIAQSTNLTIFGNHFTINGANAYRGFTSAGNLTIKDITLTNFNIDGDGGAINHTSSNNLNINNSIFLNNAVTSISSGGAINNLMGTVNIHDSEFTSNSANSGFGGAIFNSEDLNVYNSTFSKNTSVNDGAGGAIFNDDASMLNVTNSKFIDNSTSRYGGAINNKGTAVIRSSTFTNNTTNGSTNTDSYGGAINNVGTTTIFNSTFTNNKITAGAGKAAYGGAIFNDGTLNLIADGADIQFTGNTASGVSNAIHNDTTTSILNLNAGSDTANAGMIVFNDKITGQGTINVNNSASNFPTNGTILLNEDMKGYTGKVNLYNGTLKLGSNGTFFENSSTFTANGGTLDFANSVIQSQNLGNLVLGGNLGMKVDADLAKSTMDTIKATSANAGSNQINVDYINLLSDAPNDGSTLINFADSNLRSHVTYTGNNSIAYTPIYKYTVNYDAKNGNFDFHRGVGGIGGIGGNGNGNISDIFNPAVLAGPVAAQLGSYLTQLNSYNQAFMNMDMYMLMTNQQRQALKMRNKYAAADSGLVYNPLMTKYDNKAGWFRPYSTFENVPLKNGPKVSNVAYGSLFGADSEMYDLGHGFDGMFSLYAGYNGSHQAYNDVGIFQNGGMIGVTGIAYKGNFFSGLTLNTGANAGEASTMYGQENFTMLTAGVASKTGYNWELLKGKMIIQPSFLMSYSFVNTFNYRNAAGLDIQSDPLNAIQIEPGVKFIGNLKNGWQPYIGVSMIWNIMDKTIFKANDVSLPEMSVKPYVKYGVGLQKLWGERFTGFAQAFITNGGRNGVGLQAGFRWAF